MDLFEVGGEILAIRRRECQKLKGKDKDEIRKSKDVFLRIETVAENVWKKRLLRILQLLWHMWLGTRSFLMSNCLWSICDWVFHMSFNVDKTLY